MSIFISPKDYLLMSGNCEQFSFDLFDKKYTFWCKKDKINDAKIVVEKLKIVADNIKKNNEDATLDRVLIMSFIDSLAENSNSSNEEKISKPEVVDTEKNTAKTSPDIEQQVIYLLEEIEKNI